MPFHKEYNVKYLEYKKIIIKLAGELKQYYTMKKRIFLIISFCCTVFSIHSQPSVVPDSWCKSTGADGCCSLSAGLRSSTKPTLSVIAVYSSRKSEETPENVFVIRVGGRDCGVLQYRQGQQEAKTSSLTLHSSTTMLGNKSGILNVESNDSTDIRELLLYTRPLSELDRRKAETYLALKHDITINYYVSEAGDTLWNCEEAPDYSSRVFGIARDNVLGLDKVSCLSKRGDEEMRAMCVGIDAGDYLLFGEGDAHGYENSWRIVREGLAGRTVQISVGRNGRWHGSEPVAVLEKIIGATSTETHFESTSADDHYYTFAIRFENDIRGIYKLSLTTKETPQGTTAVSLGEGERNEKSASEAIYDDATAQVGIHPNPASDRIEIDGFAGKTKEVEIINPLGLSCKKVELGENEQFVDIHTLVSGNYMVVIRCGGDEYKVKLIKRGR